MQVVAQAGTGRAIVAVDGENVIRRNFIRDPRFSTVSETNWGVTTTGPATTWPVSTSDPLDQIKLAVSTTGANGGVRLALLPADNVQPGTVVHGWANVANVSGQPVVGQWSGRLLSTGTGASSSPALRSGAGSVQFSGTVGANNDARVEILFSAATNAYVTGVYAGLQARNGTFSGGDPATGSASYRWAGEQARSISEEVLTTTDTMSVYRSLDGELSPVRGYQNVPSMGASISDNDVPLRTAVRYVVVLSNGLRYYSNLITVQTAIPSFNDPTSWPIISNPVEGKGARVIIRDWSEKTYANETKRLRIPGRRAPVVIPDIESTPESTIVLETVDRAGRDTLDRILQPGEPVLLRAPCSGVDDAYITVLSRTEARVLEHKPAHPGRVHTLNVIEVEPSDMDWRGRGDTLGDLHAATGQLNNLAAQWRTMGEAASADLIGGGW